MEEELAKESENAGVVVANSSNDDSNNTGFNNLSPDCPILRIQSLCLNCEKNGMSHFMLTNISHFREVIISSFECSHCGYRDNSVQFGGTIQPKGVKYAYSVTEANNLNLKVVKGNYARVLVPEVELEIEPNNRGSITTIEGVLLKVKEDLQQHSQLIAAQDATTSELIKAFVLKIEKLLNFTTQFTFVIDDPSGNSYLEAFNDPKMTVTHYARTESQEDELLHKKNSGTQEDVEIWQNMKLNSKDRKSEQVFHADWVLDGNNSIVKNSIKASDMDDICRFDIDCPSCKRGGQESIVNVEIPYFKEIVLMSFVCEYCGFRNNQVKSASKIDDHGKRFTLKVDSVRDLSRDILKSDTCTLEVPELDFAVEAGSLGGRFTTVEGILKEIYEKLDSTSLYAGDSATAEDKEKWNFFINSFSDAIELKKNFTFILDDPAGCSYIQIYDDSEVGEKVRTDIYERSEEMNRELNL